MSGDSLEGNLVRQHDDTSAYKFYRISSKEITSGTPYNFNVNFGNNPKMDRVTEIHLISASIPNVMNNISADIGNSTFTSTATIAGAINIVLPDGFYSTSQIMAALKTEIDLVIAPSTIAISQDPITQKIEYTITGAETIDFLSSGSGNTMAPQLGITADSGAVASFTSQTTPALNGNTMVYIHSVDIANNTTYLNTNTSNINDVNGFASIPINVPYGVYQTYQATELDRSVIGNHGKPLKSLNITLRGDGGRLLTEITSNYVVSIVIKLFYHTGN